MTRGWSSGFISQEVLVAWTVRSAGFRPIAAGALKPALRMVSTNHSCISA
jgi:hypothetical protein